MKSTFARYIAAAAIALATAGTIVDAQLEKAGQSSAADEVSTLYLTSRY